MNNAPFLIANACQIGLVTAEYLPARTANHIVNHITKVLRLYQRGRFKV